MPDLRTHRAIAERFQIDFPQRGNRLHRWRRLVTLLAALPPLVLVAVFWMRGDRTIYWSGPVSSSHQIHKNECGACHTRVAQPLVRLVTGSASAHSVENASCQVCHTGRSSFDHHDLMVRDNVQYCVVCHREHSGGSLSQVTHRLCATCHADLVTTDGSRTFAPHIDSFENHPEFAVRRTIGPDADDDGLTPGEKHNVYDLARLVDGQWQDKAALRFNHAVHLTRDGVLMPFEGPAGDASAADATATNATATNADSSDSESGDLSSGESAGARYSRLTCASCHQPQSDGAYMEPIQYEQHCATCHPLQYSEMLSSGGRPLRHGVELDTVLVDAHARLQRFASEEYRRRAADPDALAAELPRLPDKQHETAPAGGDRQEWQQRFVEQYEPRLQRTIVHGCSHCHFFDEENKEGDGRALRVIPPQLPSRWMLHSRFRHDKHLGYACVVCHDPAYLDKTNELLRTEAAATRADEERLLVSESTRDILMPSIAVCQKCHTDTAGANRWGQAASDCVECHRYHHPRKVE